MDYAALSRAVSHALRHEPDAYGLELDPEGWAGVNALLRALKQRSSEWTNVTEIDLRTMIQRSAKQRHELRGPAIRAIYGHSTSARITKEAKEPPRLLYHGTDARAADAILSDGLKPMARQYVHLSTDPRTASEVGSRKDRHPVTLLVHASQAHQSGVAFYEGNDSVWLADYIPAVFISKISAEQ